MVDYKSVKENVFTTGKISTFLIVSTPKWEIILRNVVSNISLCSSGSAGSSAYNLVIVNNS